VIRIRIGGRKNALFEIISIKCLVLKIMTDCCHLPIKIPSNLLFWCKRFYKQFFFSGI